MATAFGICFFYNCSVGFPSKPGSLPWLHDPASWWAQLQRGPSEDGVVEEGGATAVNTWHAPHILRKHIVMQGCPSISTAISLP